MVDFLHYPKMIETIMRHGSVRESRIGKTWEMLGFQVKFPAGQLFVRPKMNRRLGWLELADVVRGKFAQDLYGRVAKLTWEYDKSAAYGLKIANQLPTTIQQLIDYPETRRAILHIGDQSDAGEYNKPCVDSYQFIRNDSGQLDLVMSVRSWDMISGFTYDTMVAGGLLMFVGAVVGMAPGNVHAHAGSAHVYQSDDAAGRVPTKAVYKTMAIEDPEVFHHNLPRVLAWGDMVVNQYMVNPKDENIPPHISVTNWGEE